jgi:chitin synthase
LPSISSKPKGGEAVVEDQTQVQADVDANFRETVTRAMTRIETKDVREKPTMDDQNKTFRTRLVAMWMVTNAGLAIAIENISGVTSSSSASAQQQLQTRQNTYFAIILYSTFGLSAVRFAGVCFVPYQFNVGITKKLNLVHLLLHQTKLVSMLPQELVELVLS